jgi:hypothetical protein
MKWSNLQFFVNVVQIYFTEMAPGVVFTKLITILRMILKARCVSFAKVTVG